MPRTRILCTIGPASSDAQTIAALLEAGADAFRLNFSHGTIDAHRAACLLIREAATHAHRDVAILQDLAGPKIRIGAVSAPISLRAAEPLIIERGDFVGGPGRVSCAFDALFTSVATGQRLLVDDGTIELDVMDVAPGRLTTRTRADAVLTSHKGINVPGAVRTPALTAKDVEDLRAGIAMGVDLVALSFVQSADDIRAVRATAAAAGAPDLPIVAKIEKPQAVEHVDEILEVADGLMIARGDLGIEIPLETLPAVQKRLIRAARQRGVPVILATQVLESMRLSPRPTRAEVTDAAHAVDEGVDTIMLAGETAAGQYPIRAVQTLDAIIQEAERFPPALRIVPDGAGLTEHGRALCEAAVALADRAKATAIVALTAAGKTARMLAALRPAARILAATPSSQTAARLSLVWGVTPVVIDPASLPAVRDALVARGLLPVGAVVVFVSMDTLLGREESNFVHVERL